MHRIALRLWLRLQLWLSGLGVFIVVNGKTTWAFERRYEKRYGRFWSIQRSDRYIDDDAPLYGGLR